MKRLIDKILKIPTWLSILVILLIGVRAALPYVGKTYINRYLATGLENYVGSIEDFDLSLYRGAYQLQGLEINKRINPKTPFVKIQEIDLSIAWRALWQGRLLLDATITDPEVNLVDSKDKSQRQYGKDESLGNWNSIASLLVPIDVESFRVRNGALTFSNSSLKLPLLIELTQMNLVLRNIKNMDQGKERLPSAIAGEALFQGHAPVQLKGAFNILRQKPDLDLAVSLKDFQLKTVNKLLLSYVPLSFDKGTLGVVSEIKSQNGILDGYFKPFVQGIDVVAQDESFKSLKHFGIEVGTAAANLILRNSDDQSVITQFQIKGSTEHPKITAPHWFAIAWRNAFGSPLPKDFE